MYDCNWKNDQIKVHNYFKLLILSQRWWLVYNHVGQMISPTSTFHPPTSLETAAVCRLAVWMSVTLLPVYWTLVTNTITNTARVLVQKRSRMCVCVLSCVWACVCASLRSWSRAPSPLRWERPSVEVEMLFIFFFLCSNNNQGIIHKQPAKAFYVRVSVVQMCVCVTVSSPPTRPFTHTLPKIWWPDCLHVCVLGRASQISGLKLFKLKH